MKVNLIHGLLHRNMALLFVHIVSLWLGRYLCSFRPLPHLFFFNEKIVLKHLIMYLAPPEQEECLGGSCILILTVTTFHSNIRHRPTKVSVQTAKNYKWMVYLLASCPSLTAWPIVISMRIIISISVYFLGLLLLFFGFSWLFLFDFKNLLSYNFSLLNSTRIRDLSALQIFHSLNEQALIQDFTCSKCFNFELQIVKLWVCFSFLCTWTSVK